MLLLNLETAGFRVILNNRQCFRFYFPFGYSEQKHKKSKDYCKADLKQRILFFITIFRLAIPAFFRLGLSALQ